jgi:hypothetical protein
MTPPNLENLFGNRFRVTYDTAVESRNDPWMMQIACRGEGITIYSHGEATLAIEVNERPGVVRKLRTMGLAVHQDGEREVTFLFPVSRFEEVAAVVNPRRRRVLTEEQRNRLVAIGTGHRYVSASKFASGCLKVT